MTKEEADIIHRFAAGEVHLRGVSIEIARRDIKATGLARGTPEKDFMAEVDNPCPDLPLRHTYRERLLEAARIT